MTKSPMTERRRGYDRSGRILTRNSWQNGAWFATSEVDAKDFGGLAGGWRRIGRSLLATASNSQALGAIEDLVFERKQLSELALRQEMNTPFAPPLPL